MGDWDGDGNGDIIIGSTHITTGGARAGGAVMVLLERDGSWPHFGDWQPGSRNVVFANGLGGFQATSIPSGATAGIDFAAQIDLDNNGIDDFVIDLPLMSSAVSSVQGVHWPALYASSWPLQRSMRLLRATRFRLLCCLACAPRRALIGPVVSCLCCCGESTGCRGALRTKSSQLPTWRTRSGFPASQNHTQ